MNTDHQTAVAAWFAAQDAYHKASDIYNARLAMVRAERERNDGGWLLNCYTEYKAVNEACTAAAEASETLYRILKTAEGASQDAQGETK